MSALRKIGLRAAIGGSVMGAGVAVIAGAPSGTVQALANPDPLLGTAAAFPRLGEPR